jgi:hypothetical protein
MLSLYTNWRTTLLGRNPGLVYLNEVMALASSSKMSKTV